MIGRLRAFIPLLFAVTILGCFDPEHPKETFSDSSNIASIEEPTEGVQAIDPSDTFNICAVGDMMLGSSLPKGHLPPHDGAKILHPVQKYLKGDVVFGNLEGCLADTGRSDKCDDLSGNSCFAFRMPRRYGKHIRAAGFNFLSIANNHINDYGKSGRKSTMQTLESLNISYAGVPEKNTSIVTIGDKKVGFTAFAPNQNTQSILDISSAVDVIKELKSRSDIVIVSFHGGAEGKDYQHVPRKMEYFYGEPRGDVYAFAHAAVDAGADIIIGQGPHVTRGAELYKKKLILYSLGNFCTYGKFNFSDANAFAPIVQAQLNGNGDFIKAKIVSIKQKHPGGAFLDQESTAFNYMKKLSMADFPDNELFFEKGEIKVKN